MKKTGLLLLCALLISGCSSPEQNDSAPDAGKPMDGDPYTLYTESISVSADNVPDSVSYSVRCDYKFKFSDDTLSLYSLDGVLECETKDETAHLTQHIAANGLNSNMESYYYDGTLFNEYNGITYYENMGFKDVKDLMLVPLDPYAFPSQLIEKIYANEDEEGNHIFIIQLNESDWMDYFANHYDFYGVSEFEEAEITSARITDTFSADGQWLGEKAEFTTEFSFQDQPIEAQFTSEVTLFNQDETKIEISDELKAKHQKYVASADIDTSQITDETGYDDSAEETVSATFRKRLINRLGYEEIEGDAVQMIYNTNEAYTIDFANKTFIYSNYSINYVYSWQGDLISMGACSYDFNKDYATSDCQESTIEKMKDVKKYLMMELYYCGLSLEDLQSENS